MRALKLRYIIPARGYKTLISTQSLADALNTKTADDIVVLDCAFSPAPDDAYTGKYLKSHIPGAKFFNHHSCVTSTSLVPRSIPEPYCFTKKLRHFGISSSTDVVVYDRKATSSFAARVWWLLRLFGHERVSILDGGLQKWVAEGHRVNTEESVKKSDGKFSPNFNSALIRDKEDVRRELNKMVSQLVDARKTGYFTGAIPHSESLPGGHIPGALNIPAASLYNDDGTFKSVDEITRVFQSSGVDVSKPMISMCRTGIDACSVASAAHLIGKHDVSVYYGSWTEWAQKEGDMILKIKDRSQG